MPTCRTCQGEYTHQECVCPACGQKLGRSVNLCHKCGLETGGQRLCPRCKSDVSAWGRESLSLGRFVAKGGFLGLLPTLAAVILWIFVWGPQNNSIHHPIGSIVGIILSLLIFYTLFSSRYSLRERTWASAIYHVPGPSLRSISTGSMLIGLTLMVTAVTLYLLWETPTHFSQKLIFALVYASAYVGFTTALTLTPLGGYLARLNERVPQPIFVHTDRLLEIVVQTAARTLKEKREPEEGSDAPRKFEVVDVSRSPTDGGIRVLVRECRFVQQVGHDSGIRLQWTEGTWAIDADRWGRIRSLMPSVNKRPMSLPLGTDESLHPRLLSGSSS